MHVGRENPHLLRAELLIQQRRYDLAEDQLRLALAADPNDAIPHSYLAICLSERERHTEATHEAQRGVGLAPDAAITHFVLARVLQERNMTAQALGAISEAIRLDPHNPDSWSRLASIKVEQKKYAEGLEAAEKGLAIDPDHVACTNLRAMALTGAGKKTEAADSVRTALAREPESAVTHANMGWNLLHQSQPRPAMEHFREALRLDPTMQWARMGIIEALKARWLVYRLMLRYFLFMSRLRGRAQWAVIIVGLVGYNAVRQLGSSVPSLKVVTVPLVVAYLAFAAMTWFSVPLFNLMLMLSRFGRMTLGRWEKAAATAFGGMILVAGGVAVAWALTGSDACKFAAMVTGLLVIPVAATGLARPGPGRVVMIIWTSLLTLVGGAILAVELLHAGKVLHSLAYLVAFSFSVCSFLSIIAVNIVNTLSPRVKR